MTTLDTIIFLVWIVGCTIALIMVFYLAWIEAKRGAYMDKELKAEHNVWNIYRKSGLTEMRRYIPGEYPFQIEPRLSISDADILNGSPKEGDMIARNPDNPNDQWLIAKEYFEKNYEPADKKE